VDVFFVNEILHFECVKINFHEYSQNSSITPGIVCTCFHKLWKYFLKFYFKAHFNIAFLYRQNLKAIQVHKKMKKNC